ncbi:S-layer homology domain-containing protein [Peptoniphilus catoniae]|uniref:S-layer homology domain-containing protein n=1 Tax=Peptoniphilus catoniae TaxID=1660341 RepID=UPI0010FDD27D|nr:S-layer homology domain-containing protein [Peptoniphilus catoniae]
MKKFLLMAIFIFTLINTKTYAKSYKDLTHDGDYSWAYSAVEYLSDKGIFEGYPDGNFKPYRAVSFLEIMQVIKNINNPTSNEVELARNTYETLAKSAGVPDWAIDALCYNLFINTITPSTLDAANKRGFLKDTDPVYPDRNSVTVYFARAFKISEDTDFSQLKHTDLDAIPYMTKSYLVNLVKSGIYSDTGSDGYFNGNKYIRRSEVAVIADRYLKSSLPLDANSGPILTKTFVEGFVESVSLNGKDSIMKINGVDYKFDSNDIYVMELNTNEYFDFKKIEGYKVKASLKDGIIKNISFIDEKGDILKESQVTFKAELLILRSESGNMDLRILESDSSFLTPGSIITINNPGDYKVGDILNIYANLIDRELRDIKIEKL